MTRLSTGTVPLPSLSARRLPPRSLPPRSHPAHEDKGRQRRRRNERKHRHRLQCRHLIPHRLHKHYIATQGRVEGHAEAGRGSGRQACDQEKWRTRHDLNVIALTLLSDWNV